VEFFDGFFNPVQVQVKDLMLSSTAADFSMKNLNEYQIQVSYSISNAGKYEFCFKSIHATENSLFKFLISCEKDPSLVLQEQRESELERKRQELQNLESLRQAQEEQSRIEQEMRRRADLKKKQKEIEEQESKLKLQEESELKRREKLLTRIKQQETTKKRAFEALQKLEEENSKKSHQHKQWKRTGGGFVVPFILEE
jgi:DNA repair exonuclease SbcCD ATPase subunit